MNYLDEYLKTLNVTYNIVGNNEFIIEVRNNKNNLTLKKYSFDNDIIIPSQSEFSKFKNNEYELFMLNSALNNVYDWNISELIFLNGLDTAHF